MAGKRRGGSWKPGQSGNPKGRPVGSVNPFKTEVLEAIAEAYSGNITKLRAMVNSQIERAINGDTSAFVALGNRAEGIPRQEIGGTDGGPLQVIVQRFGE